MDPLTDQEKDSYANATTCFICEKPFGNDKNAIKVRDHCHYTGKYRVLPTMLIIYITKYLKVYL